MWVYVALLSSQNNASKLLLAIMESRHDGENAEKILYNMSPSLLVSIIGVHTPVTELEVASLVIFFIDFCKDFTGVLFVDKNSSIRNIAGSHVLFKSCHYFPYFTLNSS